MRPVQMNARTSAVSFARCMPSVFAAAWSGMAHRGSVGIALNIVTVPHFSSQSGGECQPYALHGANASGGTRFGRTGCLA